MVKRDVEVSFTLPYLVGVASNFAVLQRMSMKRSENLWLCIVSDCVSQAEQQLKTAQTNSSHPIEVLKLVASGDATLPPAVRQAAAVHFKNIVKKGWDLSEDVDTEGIIISEADRQTIKSHLVQLMYTTHPQIQSQLSEAISLIANCDFPDRWSNLLPELVQQFNTQNHAVLVGVLKTANGVFRRFRYVGRSDDLYRVIIYSLEQIQAPLLDLTKRVSHTIDVAISASDIPTCRLCFEAMRIIFRIFYSLNYQDLPEFFEDHMAEWMVEFAKVLQFSNAALDDEFEEFQPGCVDQAQTAIIENLHLYASKDEDVFVEKFLPEFVKLVWIRLGTVTTLPKHDQLAVVSIKFLASLVEKPMHRLLFSDVATLQELFIKIVVPNLKFRDSDEEIFEDNPRDYIISEVEGLESESRRLRSLDLLKAMTRQFLPETTTICGEQVQLMLAEYNSSPNEKWMSKDIAVSFVSISVQLQELTSLANEYAS
jgi:exportin-2 (importin alpha re-exporter)